jgi:MFS family permease
MWGSQVISNAGDWVYVIAVATTLAARLEGAALAKAVGLLLAAEAAPSAMFGLLFAGAIADRFDRRLLLVVSDLGRAAAVASLLAAGTPSTGHLLLVAVILGLLQSLFQPSLMASLPSAVPDRQLVRANAVVTGTYHLAIMVGPALGASLVTLVGSEVAIAVNAASFAASALLLVGLRLGRTDAPDRPGRWAPVRDLVEGLRHVAGSPTARGVVIVMGLAILFLPAKSPAEIVMVRDRLTDGSAAAVATALGMLTAAWGAGMVGGSLLAPTLASRLRRELVLAGSISLIGACFLLASRAGSVPQLAAAWAIAGAAAGLSNVVYETLLQERTPDRFRGRVFATVESVQDVTYVLGALLVGGFGVAGFAPVGLATIGVGMVAVGLLPTGERVANTEPGAPVELDRPLAA